jgi:hypothetical protein
MRPADIDRDVIAPHVSATLSVVKLGKIWSTERDAQVYELTAKGRVNADFLDFIKS